MYICDNNHSRQKVIFIILLFINSPFFSFTWNIINYTKNINIIFIKLVVSYFLINEDIFE